MRRWMTFVLAAAVPSAAHAGGAAEALDAGGAPETERAPRSHWISNRIAGIWDHNAWQLRLDLSVTWVSTEAMGEIGATRADSYLGSLAAVYSADDHWSLRLNAGGSPASVTSATATVPVQGLFTEAMAGEAEAELRAVASSFAFGAGVDYDSAAKGLHSLSASLSANMTYYNAHQEILRVRGPDGATLTAAEARMRCQSGTCSSEVNDALWQSVQLIQFALGASVTDTIDGDTDLSLDATHYLYSEDPMQVGLLALATVTRTTRAGASGAPILRDSVTPSVAHRWASVSATASLSYSDYLTHEFDIGGSLGVQYKVALADAHRLTLSAKLAGGSHVDVNYQRALSFSGGLGAQYSW